MRRRDFIRVVAGSAITWPLAARAQQPAIPVVAFLDAASLETDIRGLAEFRKGLNEIGYVEGQNVIIEYRSAEGQADQLPALAAEMVRRRVAVIATMANNAAVAAKATTTTVPIVFTVGGDPIKMGLVDGLNRPGANITGVSFLSSDVVTKMLEALHELVPKADRIAALVNPTNQNGSAGMPLPLSRIRISTRSPWLLVAARRAGSWSPASAWRFCSIDIGGPMLS
jgi:putative ABC transport system substrate-binding protein